MLHRTFTNRYEVKYLVSRKVAAKLRGKLAGLFSIDANAGPEQGYFNYSIYFDSPRYYFYREKQEGLLRRIKPRLRTHLPTRDAVSTEWYLELKGRYDRTVQKRRAPVGKKEAALLIRGEYSLNNARHETVRHFEYLWNRLGLRPSVSVLYFREPLNSLMFPTVRVTFDHRIHGSLDFSLDSRANPVDFITPLNSVLVELKYNGTLPRPVFDIFRQMEMVQCTFSKYALCLESCLDRKRESKLSRLLSNR